MTQPHLSRKLIKAVDDWQAGSKGKSKKAKAIANALAEQPVDTWLTSCDCPCFRRSALAKRAVSDLFFTFNVPEETSSWTTSLAVAKSFKGGPPNPPEPGVIFEHEPTPEEVVLHLGRLHRHPAFMSSVEHWEAQGLKLHKGIRRYGATQNEVVLTVDQVPHHEIRCFGSNSVENAREAFGLTMIGQAADRADVEHRFAEAGVPVRRWIDGPGVERIYRNWLDRVLARLASIPGPHVQAGATTSAAVSAPPSRASWNAGRDG